jgi:hypothetical protein
VPGLLSGGSRLCASVQMCETLQETVALVSMRQMSLPRDGIGDAGVHQTLGNASVNPNRLTRRWRESGNCPVGLAEGLYIKGVGYAFQQTYQDSMVGCNRLSKKS